MVELPATPIPPETTKAPVVAEVDAVVADRVNVPPTYIEDETLAPPRHLNAPVFIPVASTVLEVRRTPLVNRPFVNVPEPPAVTLSKQPIPP